MAVQVEREGHVLHEDTLRQLDVGRQADNCTVVGGVGHGIIEGVAGRDVDDPCGAGAHRERKRSEEKEEGKQSFHCGLLLEYQAFIYKTILTLYYIIPGVAFQCYDS